MSEAPAYVKALLTPNASKPAARKVWSIDLEAVWLPFLTATNVTGDSCIPPEALGAPIRLAYGMDGAVKFSKAGRPVTRVVKELADTIRLVRENFAAGLMGYASMVAKQKPDEYKAVIAGAAKAGEPIIAKDKANLARAIQLQAENDLSAATATPPAAVPPAPEKPAEKPAEKRRELAGVRS